jgi:hypothetical protein
VNVTIVRKKEVEKEAGQKDFQLPDIKPIFKAAGEYETG